MENGEVDTLDPNIVRYIEALQEDANVGVRGGALRISNLKSGSHISIRRPTTCCDRFKVSIPFAGNDVKWQVIFNSCYPSLPPDFIFDKEDKGFCPGINEVKSLVNWDHTNNKSLLFVMRELVQHYKEYQEALLQQHPRLHYEYTTLQEAIDPQDIEVFAGKKKISSRETQVNFLIRLPVDLSLIPPFLIQDDPGEDIAILLMTFQNAGTSKVLPQLYLSPRVEHAIGGASQLRIPVFPCGGSLIEYVPIVRNLLANKVEHVVQAFQKRRSVLEYDSSAFLKISILQEWNDFYFVLHVDLPQSFPQKQPVMTFTSVYHLSAYGKPYHCIQKSYPYSPRWTGNEMAERARAFMLSFLPEFRRTSVGSGKLS
uniref:BRISC and BRCA1-A complex member 2 n=1 Tax=Saccoglossus kowalevskii TaxID=10224 RepID=A0ABM0MAK7_SACKO|nr:PREDICTED: BRCA1-A complex subunit BRE-like [Saccoglossus kowalevskii]